MREGTCDFIDKTNSPENLVPAIENCFKSREMWRLVDNGYELGNHTLWHANLGKYDEAVVRAQLAEAQTWVQKYVPGYQFRALALPHGVYPKEIGWATSGSAFCVRRSTIRAPASLSTTAATRGGIASFERTARRTAAAISAALA